jgi:NagD protein
MMLRSALNQIDAHAETTAMVGDRVDTDIVAGIEAGLTTYFVLTGSTRREAVNRYPIGPPRSWSRPRTWWNSEIVALICR